MTPTERIARLQAAYDAATKGRMPWGVERTSGRNWIGPMRPDGGKIDRIVFYNERNQLTDRALKQRDSDSDFIAIAYNEMAWLLEQARKAAANDAPERHPRNSRWSEHQIDWTWAFISRPEFQR